MSARQVLEADGLRLRAGCANVAGTSRAGVLVARLARPRIADRKAWPTREKLCRSNPQVGTGAFARPAARSSAPGRRRLGSRRTTASGLTRFWGVNGAAKMA